jgi:hypothetical protein
LPARQTRRLFLSAAASFIAAPALAQSGVEADWLGTYSGTLAFHGSLPLEDIYPPPANPHVDRDDRTPFGTAFRLRQEDDGTAVWLRIDGGPMQTAAAGETLRFGPVVDGLAKLVGADAKPAPRDATLTCGRTRSAPRRCLLIPTAASGAATSTCASPRRAPT